ncbi:hypothetical protein QQF64_031330, partial [Cirrhinus molitorella]
MQAKEKRKSHSSNLSLILSSLLPVSLSELALTWSTSLGCGQSASPPRRPRGDRRSDGASQSEKLDAKHET